MCKLQKGNSIFAKDLVGLKGFKVGHSATFIDDVQSVEWFDSKVKTAVVVRYNYGQSVIINANEEYIVVDRGMIAYEHMAWNFLGRGWRAS